MLLNVCQLHEAKHFITIKILSNLWCSLRIVLVDVDFIATIWWIKFANMFFMLSFIYLFIFLRRRGLSWSPESRRTSWKRCWTQRGYVGPRHPDADCFLSFFLFFFKGAIIIFFFYVKEKRCDWNARLISADYMSGNNGESAAKPMLRALSPAFPYTEVEFYLNAFCHLCLSLLVQR